MDHDHTEDCPECKKIRGHVRKNSKKAAADLIGEGLDGVFILGADLRYEDINVHGLCMGTFSDLMNCFLNAMKSDSRIRNLVFSAVKEFTGEQLDDMAPGVKLEIERLFNEKKKDKEPPFFSTKKGMA